MTPEPSNEYQKLVEAVARALETEENHQRLATQGEWPDWEALARAALSALKLPHAGDDGWQFVATISGRMCQIDSVSELLRLINGGARIESISAAPPAGVSTR